MLNKELARVLDRCLDEIAAGETATVCLARHPEHATELAPLLELAGELRSLAGYRLSESARQAAHQRIREARSTGAGSAGCGAPC